MLLEGNDDERFAQKVLGPILEDHYDSIVFWKHAEATTKRVVKLMHCIIAKRSDYIYFGDINSQPCVGSKKQDVLSGLRRIDTNKIVVVIQEIEGWYLAGLGETASAALGIPHYSTTDNITKEQFDAIKPKRLPSRIHFMVEIIKNFSIDTAMRKNRSFKYFCGKYFGGAHREE